MGAKTFTQQIQEQFDRKSSAISRALTFMDFFYDIHCWIDKHLPQLISDITLRVYWLAENIGYAWYGRAYDGSREEIEDAWEHAEEDWLNPFQKAVAAGRILPL